MRFSVGAAHPLIGAITMNDIEIEEEIIEETAEEREQRCAIGRLMNERAGFTKENMDAMITERPAPTFDYFPNTTYR
jgi:hypothetical protein